MPHIRDQTVFSILIVVFLFLALNFDRDVGFLFSLILIGDFMWFMFDKNIEFPFERQDKSSASERLLGLGLGVGLGYAFIFTAGLIITAMKGEQSVIDILASTTPPLATSKLITVLTWGLLIPFVETPFFFGRLLEGTIGLIRARFGMATTKKFDLTNLHNWWAIIIVSGLFMAFHFAAKGVTDVSALALTFGFAVVSCWVTLYFGQLRENVIMHATINTQAVLQRVGLKNLQQAILGG